uniref:Uncharacterized protein n=1 Tax=Arundo donax TaxID=35708 RepID=A0A0A8ZJ08_ARUDO
MGRRHVMTQITVFSINGLVWSKAINKTKNTFKLEFCNMYAED